MCGAAGLGDECGASARGVHPSDLGLVKYRHWVLWGDDETGEFGRGHPSFWSLDDNRGGGRLGFYCFGRVDGKGGADLLGLLVFKLVCQGVSE